MAGQKNEDHRKRAENVLKRIEKDYGVFFTEGVIRSRIVEEIEDELRRAHHALVARLYERKKRAEAKKQHAKDW